MRLKYDFELMELDDRFIAVPVGDNADKFRGIIKLNETARFIFNQLVEETTEEAIVDALRKEFDAPLDVLVSDVHKYVSEFKERGLVF